jgi:hypothetical protein
MLTALTTTVCSDYVGLVDNDASTDRHADDIHAWYAALAADHPGYTFEHYDAGPRHKWAATALHIDGHPWCVVTDDPHEFGRYLPSG